MYFAKTRLFNPAKFRTRLEQEDGPIEIFRDTLKQGLAYLEEHHLSGGSSQDIVNNRAWFMDELLRAAWDMHADSIPEKIKLTLVAVGGYGRGELHPYSDIDLMILLGKGQYEKVREFVETLIRFLWDIGLEVGHSVRSIKDCLTESRHDITVMTNLLESRYLYGDEQLLDSMDGKLRKKSLWPPKAFAEGKLAEQNQRHHRFHDTAFNLEPNLKDGPGGLRDLHIISWVFNRRYGIRDLKGLEEQGFITGDEYRTLIRGRNVLWKLRNGLHFLTGRREDRLLFEHQRALAAQYGYEDIDTHLAVEQLMKRYYRTVKDLAFLNDLLLQHYSLTSDPDRKTRTIYKPLNRRFRSADGFIEESRKGVFKRSPYALLELFYLMQQNPGLKGISAATIRSIRSNLHLINNNFRNDLAARTLFMEMIRYGDGLTRVLRRMNSYGILGAYIPVFGAIVGQMQHDLFHVYTVDAHTLMVLRNLRRLNKPEYEAEHPAASRIMRELNKPERVYLAALFHDIAKGRGGDHSVLGEVGAMEFCLHHALSEYDANLVAWMVRNHLHMSFVAQRKDISDPEVVRNFALSVGDQEHLDNLYLLTMSDIRGTSPKVWNAWKGQLLYELYVTTTRALRQGVGEPIQLEQRIADNKKAVLEILEKGVASEQQIERFWETWSEDYFVRHEPDELAWHIDRISGSSTLDLPVVAIRHSNRLETNVFLVYAPETPHLLADVAGGFERAQLNIVDAKVHASSSGFALYSFTALDSDEELSSDKNYLARLRERLRNAIVAPSDTRTGHNIHIQRALRHFPIDTTVSFSPHSDAYTVMEVVAQDQPGLLHKVALCLQKNRVRLVSARIATFGERAEDVFFITDRDGSVVDDEQLQTDLSEDICGVLNSGQVVQNRE